MRTLSNIQDAKFYVVAKDLFCSGWGGATGRNSFMCAVCETLADANKVFAKWDGRSDLRRVRITTVMPKETKVKQVSYYDGVTLNLIEELY